MKRKTKAPTSKGKPRGRASRYRRPFTAKQQQMFAILSQQNFGWALSKTRRHRISEPKAVVNEAMRKACLALDGRRKKKFPALLRVILQREIFSTLRRERRWRETTEPWSDHHDMVDQSQAEPDTLHESHEKLKAAISGLPPEDQTLIQLKYDEDLTLKEIARRLSGDRRLD